MESYIALSMMDADGSRRIDLKISKATGEKSIDILHYDCRRVSRLVLGNVDMAEAKHTAHWLKSASLPCCSA